VERTEKRDFVASLATVFGETSFVLVGRNAGLTVAAVDDLRRRMKANGATYKVAKNRLAMRALDGTRFQGLSPLLKGPTALAWSSDPVAVAKTAVEFAKGNDKFVILGGALGNQLLDANGIKALAELPSLETLRAALDIFVPSPSASPPPSSSLPPAPSPWP
jgi:large subunit ribosomal protein L10